VGSRFVPKVGIHSINDALPNLTTTRNQVPVTSRHVSSLHFTLSSFELANWGGWEFALFGMGWALILALLLYVVVGGLE